MENNTLIIFTDGAYSSIKNKGGWAFYCPQYRLRVCGGEYNTTNNRMEMMAVLKALEWVDDSKVPFKDITIVSDSQYVIQTMLGKYAKKKNIDLWNKLDLQVELLFDKKLSWVHVKGHNGNIENEIVDKFANLVSQI